MKYASHIACCLADITIVLSRKCLKTYIRDKDRSNMWVGLRVIGLWSSSSPCSNWHHINLYIAKEWIKCAVLSPADNCRAIKDAARSASSSWCVGIPLLANLLNVLNAVLNENGGRTRCKSHVQFWFWHLPYPSKFQVAQCKTRTWTWMCKS